MRPIMGLAAIGFTLSASPAESAPSGNLWTRIDTGSLAAPWLGLRVRPVSVSRLIGDLTPLGDAPARQRALGPAPDRDQLISFARSSTDAPSTSSLLHDAPRFSRLPGKRVDDYEIGLRAALADQAIALQGGFFYNKYRSLQTTVRQGMTLVTANAGKARVYGVEGLARWSPSEHVSMFATYAYSESRLKNRVRDGRKLRLSPDQTASLGAVLLLPAGPGRFAFTPSVARQSALGFGVDNGHRAAVTVVNARFGYAFGDEIEVEALVANLFNRKYSQQIARPEMPALIAGEPRVFGVRARLRLGTGG